MVIDLGKSQIFKRQVPQALDGIIGRDLTPAYLVEKLADGFGVHGESVASM
jgi:hypothetical protein